MSLFFSAGDPMCISTPPHFRQISSSPRSRDRPTRPNKHICTSTLQRPCISSCDSESLFSLRIPGCHVTLDIVHRLFEILYVWHPRFLSCIKLQPELVHSSIRCKWQYIAIQLQAGYHMLDIIILDGFLKFLSSVRTSAVCLGRKDMIFRKLS